MTSRGFTLIEVLVASAVLSIGIAALSSLYLTFNNLRRLEIQAVDAYVCSVSAMELLIQSPPACGKSFSSNETLVLNVTDPTNRSCSEVPISLSSVPGVNHLTLATLRMPSGSILQRLMRCR